MARSGLSHSFTVIPYLLPIDAQERARLDFQSYVLRTALRSNILAPVHNPQRVLDVGCASGRWASEVALAFPDSHVLGLDIAPPDDLGGERPPNLTFAQANMLDRLPFAGEVFSYTHQRMMYLAIPATAWPRALGELARVTQSGGWVEVVEGDLARNGGPALELAMSWLLQLGARRGIDPRMGAQIRWMLRQAGMRNVTARTMELPIGAYGGRIGNMLAANFLAHIEALREALVGEGIAGAQTFDQALLEMRYEMTRWRYTQPIHIVYAQR